MSRSVEEAVVVAVVVAEAWEAEAWEAEHTEDMVDTAVSLEAAMIGVLPPSKHGIMRLFRCAPATMIARPAVAHPEVFACNELPAQFPNPN
jgi:predicted RNA polymerase sigma factor